MYANKCIQNIWFFIIIPQKISEWTFLTVVNNCKWDAPFCLSRNWIRIQPRQTLPTPPEKSCGYNFDDHTDEGRSIEMCCLLVWSVPPQESNLFLHKWMSKSSYLPLCRSTHWKRWKTSQAYRLFSSQNCTCLNVGSIHNHNFKILGNST